MAQKYQGKYRVPSARACWWDYRWNAAYFVTICTADRIPYFGKIITGSDSVPMMQYSSIGKIAEECWRQIPEHFPFVTLDAFVIMPNHVHGILIFNKPQSVETHNHASLPSDPPPFPVETHNHASLPSDPPPFPVETHNHASLPSGQLSPRGPQSQSLGSVIRGFKTGVTMQGRMIDPSFKWQTRFYDHIIRDDTSWMRIAQYICDNPLKWGSDRLFVEGS